MTPPSDADCLRPPELVCEPDRRASRHKDLTDQHADVAQFVLNPTVPVDVCTHFETARNLYLYAWFVYRFYPIAEQQALTSLEFALRERLTDKSKQSNRRYRMLRDLLEQAIKQKIIRNDAFTWRDRCALERAKNRHYFEQIQKMIDAQLKIMAIDESCIQSSKQDLEHDWLGEFLEHLPKIRNGYAHGSSTLYPNVLRTFEVVMEIINQLYPDSPNPSDGLPCTDHEL